MRAAALVALGLLVALPASADDARDGARQHHDRAREHYRRAEYGAAITEFEEAYRLWPQPLFLFNIGQAYRLDGNCGEAIRYYERYLREAPDAPNHDEVRAAIARCAPAAAPPLQVADPALLPRPIVVEAAPQPFARRHRGSLLAGGAALVLGATATGLSLSSWSAYRDAAARCVGATCAAAETDAVDGRVRWTNVAWSAAAAAALTSALLFVWREEGL